MARTGTTGVEVWAKYLTEAYKDDDEDASEDEATSVWSLELECVAVFEQENQDDSGFGEDELEAFALLVGAPALHPYARTWTQMLTSQSQYPALTLGLMTSLAELPGDHLVEFPDREADADAEVD